MPTANDRAVVLNGRTVNVTNNGNTVYSLNVNNGGILDLGGTSGHNFGSISGQGLIRLSVATMPGGTYDNFVSSGGGTIEYYNTAGFTFSQLTYNNLILNLNTPALIATLNGDMIINGNLTINSGRLRINDAALTSRTLTIYGDVNVASDGSIALGTANVNHTVIVKGNFTNDGNVDFYEGNTPDIIGANYANSAHADVIFDNATSDQSLYCNGYTEFYRIVIDKGVDQTYVLNIDASASNLFFLYGRNNQMGVTPAPGPPNIVNNNSLGLQTGTVRLGPNITINSLANENAPTDDLNYHVDEDACLWIDGASVTHTSSTSNSFVLYGRIKVTNPASNFNINNDHGIVMRETAAIEVEEGLLTTPCIRTSTAAGTHRGSYTQRGGTVNITGNLNGSNVHPSLSLTYPAMSFVMSGGNLTIQQATDDGAAAGFSMVLGMDPANASVTGGTIQINIQNRNANFTSTIPLWNFIINSASAFTSTITNYPASGSSAAVNALPLVLLNDFTLSGTARFIANNQNVTIGHDYLINTNSFYTPGTNTTQFNGSGVQAFNASGTITGNLNNLTLSNTSDLTLSGNNLTVLNGLTIGQGCTLRDNGRTVTVQGNISNSGTHFRPVSGAGSIILTGTNAQVISGNGNGFFNNLTLNKTGGTVTATNNFTVTGELRLANTAARLNIGIYNLHLTSTADVYDNTGGTNKVFSATRMIQTSGLASDGGITKDYSSTSAFVFPFGMNVGGTYFYMPASIQFSSAPTTYGSVTTRPVNIRHPLATGAANALTCYWKTVSSGFTGVPVSSVRHLYYYDFAGSNFFCSWNRSSIYSWGLSWRFIMEFYQ